MEALAGTITSSELQLLGITSVGDAAKPMAGVHVRDMMNRWTADGECEKSGPYLTATAVSYDGTW